MKGQQAKLSLFTLPRELRDSIYEYGLIFPYQVRPFLIRDFRASPSNRQYRERPSLGLLSVSKAIREECLPILIGRNTWYLPNRMVEIPTTNFDEVEAFPARTIFSAYGHLFLSVVLALPHYHHKNYVAAVARHYKTTATGTRGSCYFLEDAILENIIADWQSKHQLIASMPNLRMIHINFDICYYTCSRARIPTLQRLLETLTECPVAKDVTVLVQNAEDEEERGMVRAWWNSASGRLGSVAFS